MIFRSTSLAGAYVIELDPHVDERGFFARSFCEREFAEQGLPTRFPQCNLSRNRRRGTLRGMHFQAGLDPEQKLVRCTAGAVHDVIVDLRRSSPTWLQWLGVDLTVESGRALFVPGGFAHGFVTLEDDTDVSYQMTDFFRPERARGFRWNDPRIAIRWPTEPTIVAERDATYADFVPDCLEE